MSARDDAAAREQVGEKSSPLGVDATPAAAAERRWTLRGLLLMPALFVLCGALGDVAGLLASLWFHGLLHTVVFAVVGVTVAIGTGWAAERVIDTLNSRKDGRP